MTFDDFHRQLAAEAANRRAGGVRNLVLIERADSTNEVARRIAAEFLAEELDLPPMLILAFEQSAGKGRFGRGWSSPAGKGIYASLIHGGETAALADLPLLVPVGLARGLNAILGDLRCRLKWPNDLIVGGRKIGGVLIRVLKAGEGRGQAIVGFGINRTQERDELPAADGAGGATSLRLEMTAPPALGDLTFSLVEAVERELGRAGEKAYAAAGYRELSLHRPGDEISCRVGDHRLSGVFQGFDEGGSLFLETERGERRISAGEVIES